MCTQINMFDGKNKFIIDKPIRLIELFGGYGSQHFALKYLGADVEQWKLCEWAVKSIQAYKDAHFSEDNTDYSSHLAKEQVFEYLANKGISANYNEPMTYDQVKRMGEQKARLVYNNIIATHNLVNIQQVKGIDLDIVDADNYCYVMTYSFPCQDLSSAGLGKGMGKGTGTRSGMLWEVERILDELKQEHRELPQVLLMENVPEVIGTNNIKHFAKWLKKLEELGYKNKWQVLNAKDYGVPQNRERCFMVSILGDYYYGFPNNEKLDLSLGDLLENDVDNIYYLSDNYIYSMLKTNFASYKLENKLKGIDEVADTIIARFDGTPQCVLIKNNKYCVKKDVENYIEWKQKGFLESDCRAFKQEKIAGALTTNGKGKVIVDNIDNTFIVRKYTPKECFRLMGVKDQDFERIAKNQSNASLYHLAGDSIVVDVLMAIFKQFI